MTAPDHLAAIEARAQGLCRGCNGPETVQSDEDVPLCDAHWNAFLYRYFNSENLPPCAAHLIRKESQ